MTRRSPSFRSPCGSPARTRPLACGPVRGRRPDRRRLPRRAPAGRRADVHDRDRRPARWRSPWRRGRRPAVLRLAAARGRRRPEAGDRGDPARTARLARRAAPRRTSGGPAGPRRRSAAGRTPCRSAPRRCARPRRAPGRRARRRRTRSARRRGTSGPRWPVPRYPLGGWPTKTCEPSPTSSSACRPPAWPGMRVDLAEAEGARQELDGGVGVLVQQVRRDGLAHRASSYSRVLSGGLPTKPASNSRCTPAQRSTTTSMNARARLGAA